MPQAKTQDLVSAYRSGDLRAWEWALEANDVVAAEAILDTMMPRCRRSILVLVQRLEALGCPVQRESYGLPLLTPILELDELLKPIVSRGWRVPSSLQKFWTHVGGVIFGDTYPNYSHLDYWSNQLGLDPLPYTDGLWIDPPHSEAIAGDLDQADDLGVALLAIAPDALHKDDVSGGPPYSIPIDVPNTIEPLLANFPGDGARPGTCSPMGPMGFVAYLRFAVLHTGGFPGLTEAREYEPIRRELVEGLEPF
jgi:hypothetical protein